MEIAHRHLDGVGDPRAPAVGAPAIVPRAVAELTGVVVAPAAHGAAASMPHMNLPLFVQVGVLAAGACALFPMARPARPSVPGIGAGVGRAAETRPPSCPLSLAPQQRRSPAAASAQLFAPPAKIFTSLAAGRGPAQRQPAHRTMPAAELAALVGAPAADLRRLPAARTCAGAPTRARVAVARAPPRPGAALVRLRRRAPPRRARCAPSTRHTPAGRSAQV